ncbi:NADPH-dependent F420 reductase [Ramlibacter sp. G-1-2-2]|uniref:NADPH-dependent F420 reductase n=1 Tax=Ramlibacter agri TaxID=2728837 RepID=A0A848H0F9_9BURK|nr:NADPH-dependent F420 reductase [Ramlibacter agri]NML44295.1 NADPH-dependent F420 reductase [Ramlibacter agri]
MQVGIIGAGFIARALAQNLLRAGHAVMLSNSRGPQSLRSTVASLKCKVGTVEEAAAFGEVVAVAIPMSAWRELPADALAGKVVIDIMNHYPERDGPIAELEGGLGTSELIAKQLPQSRVVKAFNAIMANDLQNNPRPAGAPDRKALPIAGDDAGAKAQVAKLVEEIGFDVVDAGPLAEGWRFERARPAYCVPMDQATLAATLAATQRDAFMGEYSWRR